MQTPTIHTAKEVAEIVTSRILPSSAKPLSERSIARLCKLGRIAGAYMAQGDWCIPSDAMENFIQTTLSNNNGRPPRTRRKKEAVN